MTDRNSGSFQNKNTSNNNKRISSIITTNIQNQYSNQNQNVYKNQNLNLKKSVSASSSSSTNTSSTLYNNRSLSPSSSVTVSPLRSVNNYSDPFDDSTTSKSLIENDYRNNNNNSEYGLNNNNNNKINLTASKDPSQNQKYQSYSQDSENSNFKKSKRISSILPYKNNNNNDNDNFNDRIIKEEEKDDLENHDHPTDFFNDAYRVTSEVDGNGKSKSKSKSKNKRNTIVSTTLTTGMKSENLEMEVLDKNRKEDDDNDNSGNNNKLNKIPSISKNYRPRPNDSTNNNSLQVPKIRTTLVLNNDTDHHNNHNDTNHNNYGNNNNGQDIPKSESGPRRQKSLIRPERARRNQRRISRGVTNFAVDDSTERWSILPPNALNITANGSVGAVGNGDGGDERRLSRPLNRRLSTREPPKKRKWYKCQCFSTWLIYTNCVTCCIPPSLLSCFGMHDKLVQRAWREKMALVSIILILCAVVGFLTFGFTQAFCGIPPPRVRVGGVSLQQAVILGSIYDLTDYPHPVELPDITEKKAGNLLNGLAGGKDISFLFQTLNNECKNILTPKNGKLQNYFPCNATDAIDDFSDLKPTDNPNNFGCHDVDFSKSDIDALPYVGDVFFDWDDVQRGDRNFIVHNGNVLDLGKLKYLVPNIEMIPLLKQISVTEIDNYRGRDLTYYMQQNVDRIQLAKCLEETIRIGVVDFNSIGCMITDVVTYVSLMVIVGVVLVRFSLAVLFGWILSWRLGSFREETAEELAMRERDIEKWSDENIHFKPPPAPSSPATSNRNSFKFLSTSRYSTQSPGTGTYDRNRRVDNRSTRMYNLPNGNGSGHFKETDSGRTSRRSSINEYNHARTDSMSSSTSSLAQTSSFQQLPQEPEQRFNFPLIHTILLVTCYSEGEQGLRTTLDSLANTDYPSSHKLIMVIADGIIKGSGNDKSTPDICLSLMNDFFILPELVQAHSYVAIADGKKRHNMARVYAGFYNYKDMENKTKRIPMVTVVKCGGPEEQDDKKPGNRGKRDSQIILMGFLQKVMFDERMTPLEYEFFNAVRNVSGVTPDFFEIVLMVDADTKIYPDSLTRMIACMSRDPNVMGLCGETKIANKTDSWVTAIQVFEYYINHHMQKAFESIFGGVTCLPGCFCMYRIKAPKGPNGYWVPILANPDIVEQYSENIVDTLHKKNLLLLGEDRYLTTLMLKTFPKRKMLFVPQAICKTIVPDTFKVLRSQRRRWINSTVHNLLELVLIPDLCGTFCFSMQFVIFMELVGTVVLPAAITFTMYLVIISFVQRPVPVIPLLLLAAVLGLPAVLILLTTRKLIYVGWMLVYLFSLPIWNFVLPVYAYWHFDDFSWGQTRVVEGEVSGEDHSRKEGVFDSSRIVMKKWAEWEREKRLKIRNSQLIPFSTAQMSPDENYNNVLSSASSITSTPATLTTAPPSAFASSRPTSVVSNFAGFDKSYLQSAPPLPFNPRGGVSKRTSTRPRADSLMIPPPLAGGPILGNNNNVFTSSPASSLMSSPLSSARSSVVYHDNHNHGHSNNNSSTNSPVDVSAYHQQQQQKHSGRGTFSTISSSTNNNNNNNNNNNYNNFNDSDNNSNNLI